MSEASSSQNNNVNQTATTSLPEASAAEQVLRDQFRGLNFQQLRAIQSGLDRLSSTDSPLAMNTQDQQTFNTAWDAAQNRMQSNAKDYADFLSGSRGLRMSDTPISRQAMDQFGLAMADLNAQRANSQLSTGLQTNQYRLNAGLGLGGALPGAGAFSLGSYLNERMAQPTTHTVGTGYVAGTQTPSGLQTGAQLAGGIGGLLAGGAAVATAY